MRFGRWAWVALFVALPLLAVACRGDGGTAATATVAPTAGVTFDDRGQRKLKGVEGRQRLFAVGGGADG